MELKDHITVKLDKRLKELLLILNGIESFSTSIWNKSNTYKVNPQWNWKSKILDSEDIIVFRS